DLISIQFSWSNPRIAKEVLETVVKAFQNASRDLNKEEQVSRTHFLGRQVEEIEAQLEAIREQKSAFQSRMGTVNTDREGISLSETRLELSNRLNQIEAARRGKEEQLAEYEKVLGMTPEKAVQSISVGQNQTLGRLYEELYRLQQQYSQQLLSLGESHPTTQETFAQIIQMRANIRAEEKRTLGSNQKLTTGIMGGTAHNQLIANMVTVRSEVEDLRAQATKLRTRLGELDSQIRAFPKMAQELTMITQRENSLSMALDQLRQKVLEGKLKEEQTLSNVFVVDAPHLPDKPDFPTRSHLMVLSLVIGVLSGVSLAVLKEQVLFTEGAEAPAWLESIDEEESEHFQPSVTPVSVRAPRANGSRFSALVPASSPIQGHPLYATGPYGPQSQSKAPEVYAEVVDEDPRTRTIKDNPYMHAPGRKTGDLAAALRSVLRDYQDTHQ
ncbi:MAG TPA: GNVR domain-containing protein, partial [Oculatellaceae cyanobacterium]